MSAILQNRAEAGQLLAAKLASYADRSDVLILALPRGGVPVAFGIAQKLNLPLDVCLVRKLGVPGQEELAMGAIATGGVRAINEDIVQSLHLSPETIARVADREKRELARRERAYRGERPPPTIRDRTIILVDDGIATGATIKAAIAILRQQHPKGIIVAVPVAPPAICQELQVDADRVVCLLEPESLHSISLWYRNFSQTTDEEVCTLLARSQRQLV